MSKIRDYDPDYLAALTDRRFQTSFSLSGQTAEPLPSVVTGEVMSREVQPGLFLQGYDITYLDRLELSAQPEPSLTLGINLFGASDVLEVEGHGEVHYRRNTPILVSYDGQRSCRSVHAQGKFSALHGITVTPDFIEKLPPGRERDALNRLLSAGRCERLPITRRFIELAHGLRTSDYSGVLAELHQDGTALAMIAELGRVALNSEFEMNAVNDRSAERARYARYVIDTNLIDTPNLQELARKIGVNVATLQFDFKKVYGTTVFDYVRDQRLLIAKTMIRSTDLPLSQVGYFVGYKSPAAFSTAYRRKFRCSPSIDRDSHRTP